MTLWSNDGDWNGVQLLLPLAAARASLPVGWSLIHLVTNFPKLVCQDEPT